MPEAFLSGIRLQAHAPSVPAREVSYNRFVELERDVAVPVGVVYQEGAACKCTGISFVDSAPLRVCKNQRIHIHKVFRGVARREQVFHGLVLRLQLHLICNEKGELLNFMITPGDVDDGSPLEYKAFVGSSTESSSRTRGYIGKNLF